MSGILGFGGSDKISSGGPLQQGSNDGQNDQNGTQNSDGNQDQKTPSIFADLYDEADLESQFDIPDDFFNSDSGNNQNQNNQNNQQQQQPGTPNQQPPADPAAAQLAEVQNMLKSVKFTQDMFPENFDPSNQQHFTDVMDKAMQLSASAAMSIMTKPIQAAMRQLESQIEAKFNTSIKKNTAQTAAEQAFSPIQTALQGMNDPNLIAMAKDTFKRAYLKSKNVEQAQKITAQILGQLGFTVDLQKKTARQRTTFGIQEDDQSGNVQQGSDAIDSFFGKQR